VSVKERASGQAAGAAARFKERAAERKKNVELIEKGVLAEADSPERVEKRLTRLRAYYGTEPVPKVEEKPRRARRRRFARDGAEPEAEVIEESKILEKIIGTQDYVDVRYFEGGLLASRAVCKVNIGDGRRETGYGTGSMVSPQLMLTNHHVLGDRDAAANSQVEFNYQDSLDGSSLKTQKFQLDPDAFFVADDKLDFALVAVRAGPDALAEFGFNPMIEAEGKAIVGEFVTIIQHPRGLKKQVALRENRIVDIPELFLHYAADTEPGSSGSPVFNDQWEIVGLHHASTRVDRKVEASGFLNEGIRVSRILRHLADAQLPAAARALLDQLRTEGARATPVGPIGPTGAPAQTAPSTGVQTSTADGALRVTIPIEVSVRVPGVQAPARPASVIPDPTPVTAGPPATAPSETAVEKIEVDPDYKNRKGYDRDFLSKRVPLPTLPPKLRAKAAKRKDTNGSQSHVLPYHHFSVVLNKERRLAFFTAVNIDGKRMVELRRGDDAENWVVDPRIEESEQTLNAVYKGEPFDRGHLVRRLDPVWGTDEEARKANDDTFHWSNAAPQHKDLNRKTWLSLEDHILENAEIEDLKVSVFSGPIFADGDQTFQGTKIPKQFWKVVAMVKESGDLSVTGYLLTQEDLIKDLDFEEFAFGEFKTFQVPVKQVAEMTGLSFGSLPKADPLERVEGAAAAPRAIDSPEDLIL
jgi:endonuclease G